ncbi:hypothetical protein QQ045_024235 [Rhodiola kirilowii]
MVIEMSFILMMMLMLTMAQVQHVASANFSFPAFFPNTTNIYYQGDAFSSGNVIQLTKNQIDGNITSSVGRASYVMPIRLWDGKTQQLTDFMSHFSFSITALDDSFGDGLTFFLAPFASSIPPNSAGGSLALFDSKSTSTNASENQIVAVEFDTFKNYYDPSPDHIGIDVNSIVSVANVSWKNSIKDGKVANAWVSYNSTTHNLSVYLSYDEKPVFHSDFSSLWYQVDLRTVLPEYVRVGFSAATGHLVEIHKVRSWSFVSNLQVIETKEKNMITWLVLGIVASICCISISLGLLWFFKWRKRGGRVKEDMELNASMESEFERGTGPKRFTFAELSQATKNYSEDGKLGEGGFGGVYKGLLGNANTPVAVKRVSKGSKQGKKEYVSEVRIISRLRHRNLVQLIGWCHDKGEFLLVYELMPNGSLDSHLFGTKTMLTWFVRYKIAVGLAAALLYLHEEWEQCVVHRDIKSSNIMLDSSFNTKLGDFGLARLVDHGLGSQTTVLAGTMGYLAPECVTTGKASKESDVYSFGVVALEIACGRRPVDPKAEASKVRLIEWVWDLYGKGQLLQATDTRLKMEYDEEQVRRLMVIGLWCCHPDHSQRPSIRQVISVLNFEAALPSLPSKLPVPMYYAPPMDMCRFSYTSSYLADSDRFRSNGTTSSSGSSKGLLQTPKAGAQLKVDLDQKLPHYCTK